MRSKLNPACLVGAPVSRCLAVMICAAAVLLASSAVLAAPSVSLVAGTPAQTSVPLSWTGSELTNFLYYDVGYGVASNKISNWTRVDAATSHTVTGLSAETAYYFQVKATCQTINPKGKVTGTVVVSSNVVQAATTGATPPPPEPPAAPTGLSATAVSTSQIDLAWTDNSSNESGFEIERSLSSSSGFARIATVPAGVTSFRSEGLSSSTTYYYRVRAYNSVGSSAYSNTAYATTQSAVTVPNAPSSLTATTASTSQINLAWADNSNNESGFKIERATSSSGPWSQIGTVTSNVTSYQSTGLASGTTYYYRVRAYNSAGDSSYSNTAYATTQSAITLPSAPSGLSATAASSSQINLAWTDNSSNESGFKIERATSSSGPWSQITTVGSNVTSYQNTGLSASTTYYYRVRAYNSAGDSSYSNTAYATTSSSVQPPVAPLNLTATTYSDSQIMLNWQDASSNEVGFKIERSLSAGSGFVQIGTAGMNSTAYSDTSLSEKTTYYYRVRAYNSGGDSAYSSIAYNTTLLKAPSNLSANAVSPTQINLTWTDNSLKESGYVVERSVSGVWTVTASLAANSSAYSDTTVQAATTYSYRVKAVGSDSAYAGPITVTTPDDTSINPQWIGKTPAMGEPYRVAISGSYAYVTSSLGLHTVDMSNPSKPVPVGSVEIASAYDLALVGYTYACVTSGSSLSVVSVSQPSSPYVVGGVEMPGYAYGVSVSGTKAYVACYLAGLVVVDIANPASPRILGSVDTAGQATAVSVAGSVAVVADGTAGLVTVDVTNASAPRILGSLSTSQSAVGVHLSNNNAYVAAGNAGLLVVNVSAPASPQLIGQASTSGCATGVFVSGTSAYIANYNTLTTSNGMQVFDISNPSAPRSISLLPVPKTTYIRGGIAVQNSVACLAASGSGLNTIDVSSPSSPRLLGGVPEVKRSTGVAASGNLLFATSQASMFIVDVTNAASPIGLASLDMESPSDIAVDGAYYAYVADGTNLKVVNVADPSSPYVTATVSMPSYVFGVCVVGSRVYAATYLAGLVVVDVANPASPRIVGTLDTPGQAYAVSVAGNLAVLADGTAGVKFIDVSNPSSPRLLSSLSTSDSANDIEIASGYAYVSARKAGLLVVSTSNPSAPVVLAQVPVRDSALGVAVSGSRVFVASFSYLSTNNGLQVFDMSLPQSPQEVAFLASPGFYCESVAVEGNRAFLTDDKNLVQIAEF